MYMPKRMILSQKFNCIQKNNNNNLLAQLVDDKKKL